MAKQLLGKEVAAALNEKIKADVAKLKEKGINPTLGIVRVGERPDDLSYERGATKRCDTLGVAVEKFLLPENVTQEELMATIDQVNKDDKIHGVLIFRPLPKHLDEAAVIKALNPEKDVDGITDGSMVGVFAGTKQGFPPCTPQACMEIPGSLWNRLHGQEGGCSRQKPCSRKAGGHDADQKERDCDRLPYQNQGYAFCDKRGRYCDRGSRTRRRSG